MVLDESGYSAYCVGVDWGLNFLLVTTVISTNEIKLAEIFRVVLDFDDIYDVSSVRRLAEAKWDSLAHVSIVAAIESEFGLHLEIADMERMSSFAATRLLLEEKGL